MKQLIAANWKMNGMPGWEAKVSDLAARSADAGCELLICPPHPLVAMLCQAASGTTIQIGGQDCCEFSAGAHTGETDPDLLSALGASYVILGHSERRTAGETDQRVQDKAVRAQSSALRPIICVGESLGQRESGEAVPTVTRQLENSLPNSGDYDIAYEPIWAIGTGRTATAQDIAAMHAAIRKAVGDGPRILYGGSVKPANAREILHLPDVGGALVGGASLEMDSFAQIAAASH